MRGLHPDALRKILDASGAGHCVATADVICSVWAALVNIK